MAARILGIEFSPSRTAIVEVSYGRQLKIFNFAVLESGAVEPERRVEQLQHTLKLRGFEAREAVVAVSGAGMEHRLLSLPHMSDRQLEFVMQREARKIAANPEFSSSYRLIRTSEQLGIKKEQILLVTSDTATINQAQSFFAQTPLKVLRMTSVSEALTNLAKAAGLDRREGPVTIAHISGGRLHLVFLEAGLMLLCRDVPFGFGGGAPEELVSRLLTEIKRSTLLFRQNFPNAQLTQVLFSGTGDFLGTLANKTKEDLGINTSVIRFEDLLDQSAFRGEWDEFRFHLPGLSAAIGAAWQKLPSSGINLLPGGTTARTGLFNRATLAKTAAAAAAVFAVATGGYYYAATSTLGEERSALEERDQAVRPKLDQISAADQQRLMASNIAGFLGQIGVGNQWPEVFRGISFVVPSSALFESIRVEGSPPRMVVSGSLSAPTVQQANADFNRLFNGLRGLGHFSSVTLSKPLAVVTESVPAASETISISNSQSKVAFEVQCEWLQENQH